MTQKKTQGHYCKVCGQRKANEKFSGKGHASHICKACSPLSAAEKAESMTMIRLENLSMRRLNDSEKTWLANRTHDKRPAVKSLAKEIYNQHFPFAERNAMKKQLRLNEVEFIVNSTVWDEFGDEHDVHCTFSFNRQNPIITRVELNEDSEPHIAELEPSDMAKLLKRMVHSLEVFCWEEDYCSRASDCNYDAAEFDDDENDFGTDFEDDISDPNLHPVDDTSEEKGEPAWSIQLKYADDKEQSMSGYYDLPDRAEELYWALSEYFADEDDEEYEDEFSFFEAAYGCNGLNELADLVAGLLADAEESGYDELLGIALAELTTFSIGEHPNEHGKRPYQTHSGASANIKFMQSFISQIHPELGQAENGKERLVQFVEFVNENFTPPVGDLISVSDLDKTMAAIEKRYKLIRRFSRDNRLQILRIESSHRMFNSICNAIKSVHDGNKIQYELYLFYKQDQTAGHPAYILLHELGHILQTEITHDTAKVPESFYKLSDGISKIVAEQGVSVAEIFADAFAMAMMQTFGWDEYDPFNMVSNETKNGLKIYMDRLIESYLAGK